MRYVFALLGIAAVVGIGLGADLPTAVPVKAGDMGTVKLVDRDLMRSGTGTKRVALNKQMRTAITDKTIPVPMTWDWTKGNTIDFPMYGNDQYGDCFYVAACKVFIAAQANATGTKVTFDQGKLINRYLALSRGDNGLNNDQILPEMKGGLIGPNGQHKILDYATVSAIDQTAVGLVQYAFGPTMYTFAVPSSVMNNIKPGVVWDAQAGNYVGGHAVLLTGKNSRGNYSLQTWGLNPPVEVTPRFIANNDPEIITTFTLEWFNEKGMAPNGFHYTTLSSLWTQITGGALPPSPFPPPDGPTPPIPPPGPGPGPVVAPFSIVIGADTIVVDPGKKSLTVPANWIVNGKADVATELAAANVAEVLIADIVKLVADVKAKAGFEVVFADLLKIASDLGRPAGEVSPAPFAPIPVTPPMAMPRRLVSGNVPGVGACLVEEGSPYACPTAVPLRQQLFPNLFPGSCPPGGCPVPMRR